MQNIPDDDKSIEEQFQSYSHNDKHGEVDRIVLSSLECMGVTVIVSTNRSSSNEARGGATCHWNKF